VWVLFWEELWHQRTGEGLGREVTLASVSWSPLAKLEPPPAAERSQFFGDNSDLFLSYVKAL